jgi:hypothetical protein
VALCFLLLFLLLLLLLDHRCQVCTLLFVCIPPVGSLQAGKAVLESMVDAD